jgi:hypothetical protein
MSMEAGVIIKCFVKMKLVKMNKKKIQNKNRIEKFAINGKLRNFSAVNNKSFHSKNEWKLNKFNLISLTSVIIEIFKHRLT